MTRSIPKTASLIAIGVFTAIALSVAIWLFVDLIRYPKTYVLVKLILSPLLLVIGLLVGIKGYAAALIVSMGNNQLTYRYLLGSEKKHPLEEIASWKEDVVKRKDTVYKRLTIQLKTGKKLQLSNHENSNYTEVVNYLKKKVKR